MKKNGFTLVELLAVIVILAVIGFIGFGSVTKINHDVKKSTFEKTLTSVVGSAETYANDNREEIEDAIIAGENIIELNGKPRSYVAVSIAELIKLNYIETSDVVLLSSLAEGTPAYDYCVHPEEDYIPDNADPEDYCYSVNHYENGESINNVILWYYFSNTTTKKVKACVEKSTANKEILLDTSGKEFTNVDMYCTGEKVGNVFQAPKVDFGVYLDETLTMEGSETWTKGPKYLKIDISSPSVEIKEYVLCFNGECGEAVTVPDGSEHYYSPAPIPITYSMFADKKCSVSLKINPNSDNYLYTTEVTKIDSGEPPRAVVKDRNGNPLTENVQYKVVKAGEPIPSFTCNADEYTSKTEKYYLDCIDDGECATASGTLRFELPEDSVVIYSTKELEDKVGNKSTLYVKTCIDSEEPKMSGFSAGDYKDSTVAKKIINEMVTVGNSLSNGLGNLLNINNEYKDYSCKDVDGIPTCYYKLRVNVATLNVSIFNHSNINSSMDIFNFEDASDIKEIIVSESYANRGNVDIGDFKCNIDVDPCRWTYNYVATDYAGNSATLAKLIVIIDAWSILYGGYDKPSGVWNE